MCRKYAEPGKVAVPVALLDSQHLVEGQSRLARLVGVRRRVTDVDRQHHLNVLAGKNTCASASVRSGFIGPTARPIARTAWIIMAAWMRALVCAQPATIPSPPLASPCQGNCRHEFCPMIYPSTLAACIRRSASSLTHDGTPCSALSHSLEEVPHDVPVPLLDVTLKLWR